VAKWTANDIPNLRGRVVVVTGGNDGLGFESAKALARNEAEVILACRSTERGEVAKREIAAAVPHANVRVMKLDLQDLASIETFTNEFNQDAGRLDVLLNNAGIMGTPYGVTRDGFEAQIGTNHLGHFALTGRLLSALKRTARSRVVTVSSSAHRTGTMSFANLLFRDGRGYTPLKAYGRSKLANLLFAYELQRRFERHGIDCISVAAHPGASQTNLGRHIEKTLVLRLLKPVLRRVVQDPAGGVLPQLRAAVDPQVRGGQYYGPGRLHGMSGAPVAVPSSRASRSLRDAKRLWQESEYLTGVRYEWALT
jgi:NAD(P)-dependent dehydrogenase (short-subunit alcohol dehydrogenase family)